MTWCTGGMNLWLTCQCNICNNQLLIIFETLSNLYSKVWDICSNISKLVWEYESSYGILVNLYLKLTRQIIEILGFAVDVQRSSVQNLTRAQETLQTKLDEISLLMEMRQRSNYYWTSFSLNSSEETHSVPGQGMNKEEQMICTRVFDNQNDIEFRLRWLTQPNQLTQENYTTVMENTLKHMIINERDEKLCYNFYGKLLTDIQTWLNKVNASYSITLGETYEFELKSQVRI